MDATGHRRPRRRRRRDSRSRRRQSDDVALILHTSGSTGRPKRVPLRARQPVDLGRQRRAQLRAGARRRVAVRDAAVPRARARGVDAGHAVDRRHASSCRRSSTRSRSGASRGPRRHLVLGGADDSPAAARARRSRMRRRPAGAEQLRFIRSCSAVAAAAGDARPRGGVRRAGARGLRHDRGRAPDGVESAAAGGAQAGLGRTAAPTCRSASWTPTGTHLPTGERGEVVIKGPNVIARLREQSRGERHVVHRRLVPHRRSGLPRRGRLSDAGRTPQGADQPRRREDLAARDRRGAARASRGGRGGVLRRAAHDVGRRGRGGGRR